MSEEEKVEGEEAPSSGGGASWMIVLLVTVLALAAGAGGAYFMLGPQPAPAAEMEPVAEEEMEPKEPGEDFRERLVTLDPFVVNVAGEAYPRFLKLKIELEADSVDARTELEARKPQVRDTTLLLLASRRLPQLSELEGRALLKDDLRERINELLEEGSVSSVLFTEFVVQ